MHARKLSSYFGLVLTAVFFFQPSPIHSYSNFDQTTRVLLELLRSDRDFSAHPALKEFAQNLIANAGRSVHDPDPNLMRLLRETHMLNGSDLPYLRMPREDTWRFLRACAQDRLTMLRGVTLISRLVRRGNIIIVVDGGDLISGMQELHLSDGLTIPSRNIAFFIYVPDTALPEPFQCRFLALYERAYVYAYPREQVPLPASVAIGRDPSTQIGAGRVLSETPAYSSLYAVTSDLRYDSNTAGLYHVRGLGIAGILSLLGSVEAMYSQNKVLVIETSRFHLQKRIAGYEAPENANKYAVHAW